ncbi:rap guanine nucleotide exchange factor 1 isoform X1 [Xiphophorus maculatus]|uniref:rap guanine nucleotide exchange factor 1 isoform X1 n=1 Tax=Xiphophorus maculatus TaxID=8083 RepID=UPI000C6D2968|nr:rap guanine nucleotide exchange factor 1 isoform X1 [Xiphophorus maculatus]
MSSRSDSKSASQIVFLTMKLKDKLHPQRNRTRAKPPDLDLSQNPSAILLDQERAVLSSLQYFKALVDRLDLNQPSGQKPGLDRSIVGGLLGGASTGILEAVQALVELEPDELDSKTVSARLARLYATVAQLIRWADRVMLQGVSHDDGRSSESVTTVIRGVLNSAKELVRLVAERREGSAPLSPDQSQSRDVEDQETSTGMLHCPSGEGRGDGTETKGAGIRAPPKPPMPVLETLPQATPPTELAFSPPALPPKRRQTPPLPVSAHCRVAIVTPIIRQPEEDLQVEDDSCCKRLSSSSADSAANTSPSEDDPDYDFLHTDLSSSETLPPALPEKRRRSTTGVSGSQKAGTFGFNSTHVDTSPAPSDDVTDPEAPMSSPLSPCKTPPPLPEKKRHIHQYLQFCSTSCTDPSAVSFYQKFKVRQRDQDSAHQLDHLTTGSAPSGGPFPAPALPPKKKQQDTQSENEDSSVDHQQGSEFSQRSGEEDEEDELLLADPNEIRHRITLKSEEEEGPEVKAASPEILLVQATQPGSSEQNQYQEAFLCTYRGFATPSDVISKLQRRYRTLREGGAGDPTAAGNSIQLLVRVVAGLSSVELESDLLLMLFDLVFCLLIGGELGMARLLHANILSKMEERWKLIGSPQSLRPLAAKGVAARPGTLLDFRSQDLAEQLTLLDSDLFCKIQLPEVLLWSKEQNEERSPHLTEFTQHFNNVSFWVRSVVILQDKAQDREKHLLKFLKVMKHLRKLNNFNSYLSILSALDSAPLRRLDWQRSTAESLEDVSSLIDSSSSFRAYRAALAEAEPPCIPYLGLILQDLTFVHLGNPDTLTTSQGSQVNFSKCWQQFNILDTLRSFQRERYSLARDDDIMSFFNDFSDHLAEEALWELSLRIRPRNAPRANQR